MLPKTKIRYNRRPMPSLNPPKNCSLCPRLAEYRAALRQAHPDWHNAPVPAFTAPKARLLVVGLAPGKTGANRTGRVFTGDYAGEILYAMLKQHGFADGTYAARPDDGVTLHDCVIANAVACVPPQNKPTPAEAAACRAFLSRRISAMKDLRAILALGRIAHESVLRAFELPLRDHPFAHAACHDLSAAVRLFDSYHCSRYNMNTKRLRLDMLEQVFTAIRAHLATPTYPPQPKNERAEKPFGF